MPLLSSARKVTVLAPPLPVANALFSSVGLVFRRAQFSLVASAPGVGKRLRIDEPIPTPHGWSTMGRLQPGDMVFDRNGKPCRVVRVSEVEPQPSAYAVTFSDGAVIEADSEHQWLTSTVNDRARHGGRLSVRTTTQVRETLMAGGKRNHAVPLPGPLDLPDRTDLPINPYTLGVWLGDGSSGTGQVTLSRMDGSSIEKNLLLAGEDFHEHVSQSRNGCYTILIHGLQAKLRKHGLIGNKRIPGAYLRASIDQRRALLAGLLDTDGHAAGLTTELTLTNKSLARDAHELMLSLGLKVSIHESDAKLNGRVVSRRWRMTFSTDTNPFGCDRKMQAWQPAISGRSKYRYIVSVEPCTATPMKCIQVDSPDSSYLAGRSMIPTHNTLFATNLALRTPVPALYFSADSDEWTVKQRACSILSGYPLNDVERNFTSESWEKHFTEALRRADHIDWCFNSDIDPEFIVERLFAHAELRGEYPKLIVVDNLGNTVVDQDNEGSELRAACRELQRIARLTGAHVMALHHVKGAKENGTQPINLGDLLWNIGKIPELVLGLHRDSNESVALTVPKYRGGKHGMHLQLPIDYSRALLGGFSVAA